MSSEPDSEIAVASPDEAVGDELRRLDRLADLLDEQFELPVVGYKIGLDPLIGLLPGGGDWVTWAANTYIIWRAARLGVPVSLLVFMAARVAADLAIGYVPGVGDVADAVYKCNRKNVDLLLEHFDAANPRRRPGESPEAAGSSLKLMLVAVGLILGLAVLAALPILLLVWWLQ